MFQALNDELARSAVIAAGRVGPALDLGEGKRRLVTQRNLGGAAQRGEVEVLDDASKHGAGQSLRRGFALPLIRGRGEHGGRNGGRRGSQGCGWVRVCTLRQQDVGSGSGVEGGAPCNGDAVPTTRSVARSKCEPHLAPTQRTYTHVTGGTTNAPHNTATQCTTTYHHCGPPTHHTASHYSPPMHTT